MIRLVNDLVIAGFGGSVHAYRNSEQVWRGYPFKEDEMSEYISDLLQVKDIDVSDRQKGKKEKEFIHLPTYLLVLRNPRMTFCVMFIILLLCSYSYYYLVDEILQGDTIVLVTHLGPHSSSTTIDQTDV